MELGRILAGYHYHGDGRGAPGGQSHCHDGNANRISKESKEGLTRYSYNANNRLVEVRYPDMVGQVRNGARPSHERFSYESAGNRTLRMRESVREEYHYDSGNVIHYIRGFGFISSNNERARTYYHYVSDEQGAHIKPLPVRRLWKHDCGPGDGTKPLPPQWRAIRPGDGAILPEGQVLQPPLLLGSPRKTPIMETG